MSRPYDTVSFLSDYGTDDEFVGVVKAVMRDLAPHAVVVDLTHGIPPFDVRAGSLALAHAIPYVPSGVVLAVVDPGVGSPRRAVAVEVADGEGVIVGPDNGLLAPAVALAGGAGRAVELDRSEYQLVAVGDTFAGRDIFAPAAAHLCNGVDLAELGSPVDPALLLPSVVPLPRHEGKRLVAEVLWVDRFGNCQLNLSPDDLGGWGEQVRIQLDELTRAARLVPTFAAITSGAIGLVHDANGMLALAIDRRSAAEELQLGPGDQVILEPLDDGGDGGDGGGEAVRSRVTLRPSGPAR